MNKLPHLRQILSFRNSLGDRLFKPFVVASRPETLKVSSPWHLNYNSTNKALASSGSAEPSCKCSVTEIILLRTLRFPCPKMSSEKSSEMNRSEMTSLSASLNAQTPLNRCIYPSDLSLSLSHTHTHTHFAFFGI